MAAANIGKRVKRAVNRAMKNAADCIGDRSAALQSAAYGASVMELNSF